MTQWTCLLNDVKLTILTKLKIQTNRRALMLILLMVSKESVWLSMLQSLTFLRASRIWCFKASASCLSRSSSFIWKRESRIMPVLCEKESWSNNGIKTTTLSRKIMAHYHINGHVTFVQARNQCRWETTSHFRLLRIFECCICLFLDNYK